MYHQIVFFFVQMPMPSARRIFFSPAKKNFRRRKVKFRRRKIHFYYIKSSFRRRNFTFRQRIFFFAGEKKIRWADGIGIRQEKKL